MQPVPGPELGPEAERIILLKGMEHSPERAVWTYLCIEHLTLPHLRATHPLNHRTEKGHKRRQREGNDGLCEHVETEKSADS